MNIVTILSAHAAERPGAPALIVRGRTVSFADLDRDSARVATLLERGGLGAGDVVLIFYPMSIELYTVLLAVFRLGLVAMFLDPSAGRRHVEQCCAEGAPRSLVAGPKAHLLRFVSPAVRRIPIKYCIGGWVPGATPLARAKREALRAAIAPCAADAAALLTFTSGSTGAPKAAVRTHGFLLAQHRALERSLSLAAGDVDLTTLPIFVLANLASGVTSVIPDADLRAPGRIDPAPVVAQIREHRVVTSAASPALFERVVEYCERERVALDGLRRLFTGGAPVFPRLLDRLARVAPGADVVAVYGSTEAEPIAEVSRRDIRPADTEAMANGRGLLTGRPVPEITLRILRDRWGVPIGPYASAELDAECMPAGDAGEIVVTGDHVLAGYLRGRGDAETKFRVDGRVWHRTGDAGYLDGEGRLWLLGRCSARVEDARGELYPFAVECAVSDVAGVRRSALAARAGRRVLAVEPSSPAGRVDVAGLAARLAWAHIDEVRVLDRIPVDTRHNAKVDYPALLELLDR